MRIFTATPRYIQGPGVLRRLPSIAAELGKAPVLVIDRALKNTIGMRIEALFERDGAAVRWVSFEGETTHAAVADLAGRAGDTDLVVGIGGGRTLDAAKALAHLRRVAFVSVPTVASTDAPASRGIVIYDDDHRPAANQQMVLNPATVLVDTEIIVNAPIRFLQAGMGDAIAKMFEAQACASSGGKTKHGLPSSDIALAIGELCYRTIRRNGVAGLAAARRRQPDKALEALVEACLLMSALAFENGGLSVAHAIVRGLVTTRAVASTLHGEQVAFGLLVQLVLEHRPADDVADLTTFYRSVGLPTSLEELGLPDPSEAEIEAIADHALTAPSIAHTTADVTRSSIANAILSLRNVSAC